VLCPGSTPAFLVNYRLKAVIDEKCVDRPPTCEEMRAKLATLDPNSQEYAELRFQIISQCGG
jgi:hypothetical protein